jgi:hypothetical protein
MSVSVTRRGLEPSVSTLLTLVNAITSVGSLLPGLYSAEGLRRAVQTPDALSRTCV